MRIRPVTEKDRARFIELTAQFYHSPAVLAPIPEKFHAATFDELMRSDEYLSGYLLEEGDAVAGYALTAKTFSPGSGSRVIWIEELYVLPAFRGRGIGQAFFAYLQDKYPERPLRLRLEVEKDNVRARALYERLGFKPLPYVQMIKDL